ncbi:MAG: hypothetical protein AB8B91_16410 [Rubripirellula sp.]
MFRDVVGGATGAMFPTGARIDRIDGHADNRRCLCGKCQRAARRV